MKVSPLDLMSALLKGNFEQLNASFERSPIVVENREVVMIVSTSLALLIGCAFLLILRKFNGEKSSRVAKEVPKPLIVKEEEEEVDVDHGKKKVTVFFGSQTGTAEGFAKVSSFSFFCFGIFLLVFDCLIDDR